MHVRAFEIRFNFSAWHNKAALKNIYNTQVQFKCWAKSTICPRRCPVTAASTVAAATPSHRPSGNKAGKNEGPHITKNDTECFFFISYFEHFSFKSDSQLMSMSTSIASQKSNWSFGWPRSVCVVLCWVCEYFFFFGSVHLFKLYAGESSQFQF